MRTKALFIALMAVAMAACNTNPQQKEDDKADNSIVTNVVQNTESQAIIITPEGAGDLKIGSTIPDMIPGCEIKPFTIVYEEDIEDLEYQVFKDGKVVLTLFPTYEDESDVPSDKIRGITVYSDQYVSPDQFHVGSKIQDILKKQGVKTSFNEENFLINDNGILYVLFPEDYEGELPDVPFDNPIEIEHPTFKADAQVRMIQIFGPID